MSSLTDVKLVTLKMLPKNYLSMSVVLFIHMRYVISL
jgi:hypothetical protein